MDERARQRLQDIVDAADELADALSGMTLDRFQKSRMAQRTAERLLEIAGEAANHLPAQVRDSIEANWSGLRALRVLLAHAYHRVDVIMLWRAATQALPPLAARVRDVLASA